MEDKWYKISIKGTLVIREWSASSQHPPGITKKSFRTVQEAETFFLSVYNDKMGRGPYKRKLEEKVQEVQTRLKVKDEALRFILQLDGRKVTKDELLQLSGTEVFAYLTKWGLIFQRDDLLYQLMGRRI